MKSKKPLLALLVLAVAAAAGAVWYMATRAPAENGAVRVSGNIEITDAEIAFKLPGRVAERRVTEGDLVKAGDVVARLESQDLADEAAARQAESDAARAALAALVAGSRPEEIAAAEAAVGRARSALDDLLAGSRPQEIAAAEATLARAQAEAEQARLESERQDRLAKEGAATPREVEQATAARRVAEARVREAEEALKLVKEGPRKDPIEQARAALKQVEAQRDLVRKGPRQEDIDQARARAAAAEQALALARTRLAYATVVSPLSGLVLSKNIEPGEFVSAGTPVVTVGDLVSVWVRAYISETDLGRVKVGQRAAVTTDAWPGRTFEGRVSFLSPQAEFTPKNVQTSKERVKLVYRVKIDIANPDMTLKAGMPADAAILTGE
jgi:HlyD family secretion protein